MTLIRQRAGAVLAIAGTAACIVALLLPWLKFPSGFDGDETVSGWTLLTAMDVAITVLAALAAAVALARLLARPGPAMTMVLAFLAGLVAVLAGLSIEYLVLEETDIDVTEKPTFLLGLAGVLLLVAGVGVASDVRSADAPVGRALMAFAAVAAPLVALLKDDGDSLYEQASAIDIVGIVVSVALVGFLFLSPTKGWAVWASLVLGGYVAGFGLLFALERVAADGDLSTTLWLSLLVVSPSAIVGGFLLARSSARAPV